MTNKNPDFIWISNESKIPYVTIDAHKRLYISTPARKLLGVEGGSHFRLITGYDFANHRIVIAKPEIVRIPDVVPFNFDKRSYSRVKPFVDNARLDGSLPIRFLYVGKDYSDYPRGSYAFERAGFEAGDK